MQPSEAPVPAAPAAEPAARRRVLIVEDDELTRRQMQQLLSADPDLHVDTAANGTEALEAVVERNYSIVLTDLRMPQVSGLQLIEEVQKRRLPVTVVVTTGTGGVDDAVQAMRAGAYDFITKPVDVDYLRLVIRRILHERSLQDEITALREQLNARYSFFILSKNPRMQAVFELIHAVARTTTTVLIEGETGTGKELVARAIHQASEKRRGPMVAVNCAALPENLLESEMFGHEKGAFTSAVGKRKGRFELADGGTIFLDEVGDVPAAMQVKLLRVLQERKFERVGGAEPVDVDVRVIAATNRSLKEMVQEGTFRQDLFYRLNVVKIDLPPLRERKEDVPLLAAHFLAQYTPAGRKVKGVAPEAMQALLAYPWPGNVRELENAVERACVTCAGDVIRPEHLPPALVSPPAPSGLGEPDLNRPLGEILDETTSYVEEQYLRRALEQSAGDLDRCAEICGLSRRSLNDKINRYRLPRDGAAGAGE